MTQVFIYRPVNPVFGSINFFIGPETPISSPKFPSNPKIYYILFKSFVYTIFIKELFYDWRLFHNERDYNFNGE